MKPFLRRRHSEIPKLTRTLLLAIMLINMVVAFIGTHNLLSGSTVGRRYPPFAMGESIVTIFIMTGILLRHRHTRQIQNRRESGACISCGYSLLGNVSGVCPECGTVATELTK